MENGRNILRTKWIHGARVKLRLLNRKSRSKCLGSINISSRSFPVDLKHSREGGWPLQLMMIGQSAPTTRTRGPSRKGEGIFLYFCIHVLFVGGRGVLFCLPAKGSHHLPIVQFFLTLFKRGGGDQTHVENKYRFHKGILT